MERSHYHSLATLLWRTGLFLLVALAVYVSVGRLMVANLGRYGDGIVQELNLRVPFDITADRVSGSWRSFSPVVILSGLRVTLPESPQTPLQLTQGRVEVDVWSSLVSRSLKVSHLELDGLTLLGELSPEGGLRIKGLSGGSGTSGSWIQAFLLNARHIALRDNILVLTLPSGEERDLDLDLTLARRGSDRRVEAKLRSTRGADISVLGHGLGNPLKPESFSGNLYVSTVLPDLGAARDLVASGNPPLWAQGELDLELWLLWDKGSPSVETRVEARDLVLTPREGEWEVPLQRLGFEAHVTQQQDAWTFHAEEVRLENADLALELPRLQLDLWGGALRLRAADVQMGSVIEMASTLQSIPEQFDELVTALDPAAYFDALQLSIGDFEDPAREWELEVSFDELSVAPWKGAPGVRSATGYLQLRPGEGALVLDSADMELQFPTIYEHPLAFAELYSSLYLNWDDKNVTLSSGLISARGEEGEVRGLFGLNIPLEKNDVGIEMDLLVGLADSRAQYRDKYIPNILAETLQQWLSDSIGDGELAEAGFLWRGSLKGGNSALRTVQLAFNVADADLTYHPDWPAVTVDSGIVLIDDGNVSVWSESAGLLQSDVHRLSVETMVEDGEVTLQVAARIEGPAADGLLAVNDSPLASLVGQTFVEWDIQGALSTDLALEMQLGGGAPAPRVEVQTDWREVDLNIVPGNIPLRNVRGDFLYSSAAGFASSGLAGNLWGEPVELNLVQHHEEDESYDASTSALEVTAASRVAMQAVQEWLDIGILKLAQGAAPVDLSVFIQPGSTPELAARSTLQGVSLDLPDPWRKPAGSEADFRLSMQLGGADSNLDIALGEELDLQLKLADGGLRSGALGVSTDAPEGIPGELRIGGEAPLVDVDQWIEFISTYIVGGNGVGWSLSAPGTADAGQQEQPLPEDEAGDSPPGLRVVVDGLQAQSLTLGGNTVDDVTLGLVYAAEQLAVDADTEWLSGQLDWPLDGSPWSADIEYLNLSAIPELDALQTGDETLSADAGEPAPELPESLPPGRIVLRNIHQGDDRLGDLTFALEWQGERLSLHEIVGELAHIRFEEQQPARLEWQMGESAKTHVSALLGFDDLGDTLAYFGYEETIETRSGEFTVDLNWPGSPADFALLTGAGSLQIDIGPGSFNSASAGAAGALRVIGILDLVGIVQRLSVSHMFDSGIPFDSVNGEIYLHSGVIEVPQVDIKGGSRFRFTGVSDVALQSLNAELVATLPVAKNLPWVAALAAGVPVAAGVYVASKIFDKQVNRLSSAVYSIEGTWAEPEVKFSRIFDDSAQVFPPEEGEAKSPGNVGGIDAVPSAPDPQDPAPAPPGIRSGDGGATLQENAADQVSIAPDPQNPVSADEVGVAGDAEPAEIAADSELSEGR